MRPNGTQPPLPTEPVHGWGRVTSMARWLARRRQPAGARPRLSVVIPVYNAEATLAECLTRLCNSSFTDFEIVLVDDGSTDRSRAIAGNFPLSIVPTSGRVGPAAARNLGARAAAGDILVFMDSDVMVRPETIGRIAGALTVEDLAGVVGVQAADMRHRDLVSQYKNLWMRWTYARRQDDVPLFYTTLAAIRREVFLHAGGFDPGYATPNVEDTAFGQKLARLGIRVRVDPTLEVEHVKRYTLAGLLRTDFTRAVALTRLKLRQPRELGSNNTSVPTGYIVSVPLATAAVPALAVGGAAASAALTGVGLLALAAMIALNQDFVRTIRASEGWGRAVAAIPLLWLELLVVGAGTAAGMVSYLFGRRY